ncbi:hypothetical protein BDE02_02G182100 [Populus trichocarpa]|nr:hypothetical protein BDE02_02G182100 [Populus trichocarpa]
MVAFWLYGLYDPDWEFEVPSTHLFGYKSGTKTVNCGVKGSLEPPCNAAGLIDRFFLVLILLTIPLVPDSPGWFLAPFDSKGILSLVIYLFILRATCRGCICRVFSLYITGYVLKLLGVPFYKPLYMLSYVRITAEASGLALMIIFYIWRDFEKIERLKEIGMKESFQFNHILCRLMSNILENPQWEAIRRERERARGMATEKADVEVSDTNNDGIQNTSTHTSVNSETPTSAVPRFGKALAHRALYGSSSRHGGSRKARSSDVKTLPSRLSKVSLADDTENRE